MARSTLFGNRFGGNQFAGRNSLSRGFTGGMMNRGGFGNRGFDNFGRSGGFNGFGRGFNHGFGCWDCGFGFGWGGLGWGLGWGWGGWGWPGFWGADWGWPYLGLGWGYPGWVGYWPYSYYPYYDPSLNWNDDDFSYYSNNYPSDNYNYPANDDYGDYYGTSLYSTPASSPNYNDDFAPSAGNELNSQGSPDPNPVTGNVAESRPTVLIYLKDGTMYPATDYWFSGHELHYVVSYGGESSVDMSQVDIQRTVDENAKRGIPFSLKPAPASYEPGTAAAPSAAPQPAPQVQSAQLSPAA